MKYSRMIYLDNNSTMEIYPQVISAVNEAFTTIANTGSPHTRGRNARKKLETARQQVAQLIHATPKQVLFVSGATEANNMALMGGTEKIALVSAIEHSCVKQANMQVVWIPVDKNGVVDTVWLDNRLKSEPAGTVVVSVMTASHEVGTLQPIDTVARICAKHLQRLHVDAVQGAGKIPLDFQTMGVQSMAIAPHKFGGIQGIGALIYDPALNLRPLLFGGGQENGVRPGTVNLPAAVGFGVAAHICVETMAQKTAHITALQQHMENRIVCEIPDAVIIASGVPRLPGTSRIVIPGLAAEKQVMMLDLQGICVSSGAACSTAVLRESEALKNMGYPPSYAQCSIRVGLCWHTQQADIDRFLRTYIDMVNMSTRDDI